MASPEQTGFIPISDFPLEVCGETTALGIHPSLPVPRPGPERLTSNLTLLFLVVVFGLRGGEKFTFGFQSGDKNRKIYAVFSCFPCCLPVIEDSVLMN